MSNTMQNMEETQTEYQELNDKYIRLAADFENYKKRTVNEKQEIRTQVSKEYLNSIMDLDNDLRIMITSEKDTNVIQGLNFSLNKIKNFLTSKNVELIEVSEYDPELHDVVSKVQSDKEDVKVVSNGYKNSLNNTIYRFPKVILFTNK